MIVIVKTMVSFDPITERDKIEKFIRDDRECKWTMRESTIATMFEYECMYGVGEKKNETR